ncbi:energy transducer TonB [Massilia sp. TSP1-1-2]|uniref:energy transducer TonB n=1 Tax=unclassified Massilia TaxID=2609279 RepID=UPI003CF04D08
MSIITSSMAVAAVAALAFASPVQAGDNTSDGNQPGQAIFSSCEKPQYPKESIAAKQEGTVNLAYLIAEDGAVLDAKVNKSSGYSALDTAAVDTLKLCKFHPAMKNGKAVQDWVRIQYVWTLK